jgi:hypothetical protein
LLAWSQTTPNKEVALKPGCKPAVLACFVCCAAAAPLFAAPVFEKPGALQLKLSGFLDQRMTEILYADSEPEQSRMTSRILFLGDRMRMDFGQDDQGFVLFDRAARTVWHVSPQDQKVTGIVAGEAGSLEPKHGQTSWPQDWKLSQDEMRSDQNLLTQLRLNKTLCVEFKSAPMLSWQAQLLAEFRQTLAANQARLWLALPQTERQPCAFVVDVERAGIEYRRGLPLAIRYWDGRSRVYLAHQYLPPRPELFDLPKQFRQVLIGAPDQAKESRRQPRSSQAR